MSIVSLSPHGESGLKWSRLISFANGYMSLPAWGEWIEIYMSSRKGGHLLCLPAWGEWIEIPMEQS